MPSLSPPVLPTSIPVTYRPLVLLGFVYLRLLSRPSFVPQSPWGCQSSCSEIAYFSAYRPVMPLALPWLD